METKFLDKFIQKTKQKKILIADQLELLDLDRLNNLAYERLANTKNGGECSDYSEVVNILEYVENILNYLQELKNNEKLQILRISELFNNIETDISLLEFSIQEHLKSLESNYKKLDIILHNLEQDIFKSIDKNPNINIKEPSPQEFNEIMKSIKKNVFESNNYNKHININSKYSASKYATNNYSTGDLFTDKKTLEKKNIVRRFIGKTKLFFQKKYR